MPKLRKKNVSIILKAPIYVYPQIKCAISTQIKCATNTMEITPTIQTIQTPSNDGGGFKNGIIFILIVLLAFTFIGINLLEIFSGLLKNINDVFSPIIALIGNTTGKTINTTADIVSDTAKTGIEIAEDTVQNVGDLLIKASKGDTKLDKALSKSKLKSHEPDADTTENPIQNPISKSKNSWCLVGEFESRRGCIEVGDTSKCMSGQTFPTRELCMNPTQTPNIHPK